MPANGSRREVCELVLKRRTILTGGGLALLALSAGTVVGRSGWRNGAAPNADVPPGELLRQANSWAYQLQNYDFRRLAASDADVMVVDYSISGDDSSRLSASTIRRLQKKADGSRRLVLAYLSIGEAEEYRFYWKPEWIEAAPAASEAAEAGKGGGGRADAAAPRAEQSDSTGRPMARSGKPADMPSSTAPATADKPARRHSPTAPTWLGDENEAWSGNFAVHYEQPEWQAIFLDGPGSYLARIVEAGFDGVYLDRVDAFYDHPAHIADADGQMIRFVAAIAAKGRQLKPGFLVVPQNAEELLLRPGYADLIDAIAKEDLYYGSPDHGLANSKGQIANSLGWLGIAKRKGRPVLVVEYLDDAEKIAEARAELERNGFVATFAPRLLDELSAFAAAPPRETTPPQTR